MFVSVIANQIRTPVDWISASAIVLVTPAVEFVGAVREGDSRRSTLRYRARHRPALHDATTGTSAPVSGRDHVRGPSRHRQTPRSRLDIAQITPRFSSAAS